MEQAVLQETGDKCSYSFSYDVGCHEFYRACEVTFSSCESIVRKKPSEACKTTFCFEGEKLVEDITNIRQDPRCAQLMDKFLWNLDMTQGEETIARQCAEFFNSKELRKQPPKKKTEKPNRFKQLLASVF